MSEWMGLEITLGLGSIVLGMLAGRLSTWVACWLPAFLEQQWQRDARNYSGWISIILASFKRPDLRCVEPGPRKSAALSCR